MNRYARSLLVLALTASAAPQLASQDSSAGHLVEVGAQKMFLNCTGHARGPTVILEAGSGDSSEVWTAVQNQVAQFAHVCSYDRLGLGKSDRLAAARTTDQIVSDLHQLLQVARLPPPYLMVGHSIGGIYVRKYAVVYPTEVTGLVLLDSAHEEQFARVSQISPEWAQRIRDRFSTEEQRAGGFLAQGERLEWHFNGPLIVIEHEQMPPSAASDPMAKQSEAVFHLLQKDLAGRSKLGQLREAKKSGHYIQRDEPELVIQAIKDVLRSFVQAKKSSSQIPIATTITDLVHPDGTFAGKLVRVVASLHSDGIHTSVLLEPNCGVLRVLRKRLLPASHSAAEALFRVRQTRLTVIPTMTVSWTL